MEMEFVELMEWIVWFCSSNNEDLDNFDDGVVEFPEL